MDLEGTFLDSCYICKSKNGKAVLTENVYS